MVSIFSWYIFAPQVTVISMVPGKWRYPASPPLKRWLLHRTAHIVDFHQANIYMVDERNCANVQVDDWNIDFHKGCWWRAVSMTTVGAFWVWWHGWINVLWWGHLFRLIWLENELFFCALSDRADNLKPVKRVVLTSFLWHPHVFLATLTKHSKASLQIPVSRLLCIKEEWTRSIVFTKNKSLPSNVLVLALDTQVVKISLMMTTWLKNNSC